MPEHFRGPRGNIWCALFGHDLIATDRHCLRRNCMYWMSITDQCELIHAADISKQEDCMMCNPELIYTMYDDSGSQ